LRSGRARTGARSTTCAQNFEAFQSRCTVTRRRAGQRREMLEPLFPGYVFVALDRIDGEQRVFVLLDWMQRRVRVAVERGAIEIVA